MTEKRNCTIVAPKFVDHEDPLVDNYPEVNSCNVTPFHVLRLLKFAFCYRILLKIYNKQLNIYIANYCEGPVALKHKGFDGRHPFPIPEYF